MVTPRAEAVGRLLGRREPTLQDKAGSGLAFLVLRMIFHDLRALFLLLPLYATHSTLNNVLPLIQLMTPQINACEN